MMKLLKMKIRAVALVDKGANRRDFFLIKNFKGGPMKKEQVIELLKSAKSVSKDTLVALCKSLPVADQAEVEALMTSVDGVEGDSIVNEEEQFIEKVSAKLCKATGDQMKSLQDAIASMQATLTDLMNGLKDESTEPIAASATPEMTPPDAPVSEEEFKKMLDEALTEK